MPGIGGTIGFAPGERIKTSYSSLYVSSVVTFFIVIVFSSLLIFTTSLNTRISKLKRFDILSTVCTNNFCLSVMTPPI
ncbi:Uncharacterised protein [Streptococcus pneumoniae]|nr:Uncharacterised protein [Streptococcus pneumoniae]